jgi:hypothetical protein
MPTGRSYLQGTLDMFLPLNTNSKIRQYSLVISLFWSQNRSELSNLLPGMVLNRLCNVGCLNINFTGQISDGAGWLENGVVSP